MAAAGRSASSTRASGRRQPSARRPGRYAGDRPFDQADDVDRGHVVAQRAGHLCAHDETIDHIEDDPVAAHELGALEQILLGGLEEAAVARLQLGARLDVADERVPWVVDLAGEGVAAPDQLGDLLVDDRLIELVLAREAAEHRPLAPRRRGARSPPCWPRRRCSAKTSTAASSKALAVALGVGAQGAGFGAHSADHLRRHRHRPRPTSMCARWRRRSATTSGAERGRTEQDRAAP